MRKRKGNYKYNIGDIVKVEGSKAQIVDRWWDDVANNRYAVRFVIGKNQTGIPYAVIEKNLMEWEAR